MQGEGCHVVRHFEDRATLTMSRLPIAQGRYSGLQHALYPSKVAFKRFG